MRLLIVWTGHWIIAVWKLCKWRISILISRSLSSDAISSYRSSRLARLGICAWWSWLLLGSWCFLAVARRGVKRTVCLLQRERWLQSRAHVCCTRYSEVVEIEVEGLIPRSRCLQRWLALRRIPRWWLGLRLVTLPASPSLLSARHDSSKRKWAVSRPGIKLREPDPSG